MHNAQWFSPMKSDYDNIIVAKSKAFALRCIKLYEHVNKERHLYDLTRQLLRAGTSIGANVNEAVRAQSNADFGTKMNIALKEANESEYWLELFEESEIITQSQADSMLNDCREIIRILMSIVKTTFDNINRKQ